MGAGFADFADCEPDDLPVATVRRLTGAVVAGATVAAVGVVFGTAGPDVWADTELCPSMARHMAAPAENLTTARVVLLWDGLLWDGQLWDGLLWDGLLWDGLLWDGQLWDGQLWDGIVDSDWSGDRKQVIAMVLSNVLLGDAAVKYRLRSSGFATRCRGVGLTTLR